MVYARYWRFYGRPNGQNNLAASEIEWRDSEGGSDISGTDGGIWHSQFNSSFLGVNAYDGTTATAWASINLGTDYAWIGYDFGSPVEIRQMAWTARADAAANQAIGFGTIQYSDDGDTWNDIVDIPQQSSWSLAEQRTFNVPEEPVIGEVEVSSLTLEVLQEGTPEAELSHLCIQILWTPDEVPGNGGIRRRPLILSG